MFIFSCGHFFNSLESLIVLSTTFIYLSVIIFKILPFAILSIFSHSLPEFLCLFVWSTGQGHFHNICGFNSDRFCILMEL